MDIYKRPLLGSTLVLAAVLAGCATVPMQDSSADAARKQFSPPPPDRAGLYIYRDSNFGGALKKTLYIDGQVLGESGPMTYFYLQVPEGERRLSTESEFSNNDLLLAVEPGQNYFVRQSIKMGLFVGGAALIQVSEATGRQGVAQCRLARTSNPELRVTAAGAAATPDTAATSPVINTTSDHSAYEFYGQAEAEIDSATYDRNLWARALVEAEGVETARKAEYIKLRADQLYQAAYGSTPQAPAAQPATAATAASIDFSGTYRSEITGSIRNRFNPRDPEVTLFQDGDTITGTFDNRGGRIWGEVDGNSIEFDWISDYAYGKGKWTFERGSGRVKGRWHTTAYGDGDWNLTHME